MDFAQAIIENIFMHKDRSGVAGCTLLSGSVKTGDRLYYVDGVGRKCFPVTVTEILIPQKGTAPSVEVADKKPVAAAFKLAGCGIQNLHGGHMLQSEPEEILYESAPGWDAIAARFEKRYTGQKYPIHFGTFANFRRIEQGPLDGISIYNGENYFHFVTFGLSELYEKQNGNPQRSGYGFELTVKLKKEGLENAMLEIRHMCCLLQLVANVTVNNGHQFLPGQFIATGLPKGMDAMGKSSLKGFITKEDELGTIHTAFGNVQLIQLVGVTDTEMEKLKNREVSPAELGEQLRDGLTDYKR